MWWVNFCIFYMCSSSSNELQHGKCLTTGKLYKKCSVPKYPQICYLWWFLPPKTCTGKQHTYRKFKEIPNLLNFAPKYYTYSCFQISWFVPFLVVLYPNHCNYYNITNIVSVLILQAGWSWCTLSLFISYCKSL